MSERPETAQSSDYDDLIPGVPSSSSTGKGGRSGKGGARQPRRGSRRAKDADETSSPPAEQGADQAADSNSTPDDRIGSTEDGAANSTNGTEDTDDASAQPAADESSAHDDPGATGPTVDRDPDEQADGADETDSSASAVSERGDSPLDHTSPAPLVAGELLTPSGEDYGLWLDRSLRGARDEKSYSAPAISDRHGDILEDTRRSLRRLGYSRRQLSFGNLIELALETQADYVSKLLDEQSGG